MFSFKVLAIKGWARAGELVTPHGVIKTPVFMPVGTQASVKSLSPDDLVQCGAQIILANTYHLHLRPGDQLIRDFGGLHEFMQWQGPILTDSGGYQVSSLGHFLGPTFSGLRKDEMNLMKPTEIDEDGVTFYSHLDGTKHRLTAEKSIEIQENLGADIIMAFDEATPGKGRKYAQEAMHRTHAWLDRSIAEWAASANSSGELKQALFGIVQGGDYKELRRESARVVAEKGLPGIAMGGGSVGQNPEQTAENVSWIHELLPANKPLYLMGVGVNPVDVIEAVKVGADMFDCVAPTRLARMGQLYNGELTCLPARQGIKNGEWSFESEFKNGRLNIDNARFRQDKNVISDSCDCYTCTRGFKRGYLLHLFRARELLYYRLASLHNVRFMLRLVEQLRMAMNPS